MEAIAQKAHVSSAYDTEDNLLENGVLKCKIGGILKKLQVDLVAASAKYLLENPPNRLISQDSDENP